MDTSSSTGGEGASKEPSRRHRTVSSSPHNQRGVLRGLSGLQRAPVSRQGSLKSRLMSSESFVRRLEQQKELDGHDGCVNTIAWDETGEFLLSGSDDHYLNIYRPLEPKPLVHSIPSGHTGNVFSAKFLANSSASHIVSCCADGTTRLTNVHRFVQKSPTGSWSPSLGFRCHVPGTMTYEVMPDLIDGHIFYDCSDDGKINRYDTRIRTSCKCGDDEDCERHTFVNINSHLRGQGDLPMETSLFHVFHRLGVSAITQRPENPTYIAAACGDDTVRIYDARYVSSNNHRSGQVYSFSPYVPTGWVVGDDGELQRGTNRERGSIGTRITALKYDPCRTGQLLASYSRGNCYLIDPSGLATRLGPSSPKVSSPRHPKSGQSHVNIKGKRRRGSDAGSDHLCSGSSNKKAPGSWSPTLPRRSSTSRTTEAEKEEQMTEASEDKLIDMEDVEKGGEDASGHVRFRLRPENDKDVEIPAAEQDDPQSTSSPLETDVDQDNSDDIDEDRGKTSQNVNGNRDEDEESDMDDDYEEDSDASDEDEDSDVAADDEKEYWTRQSYKAGKSDLMQMYSGHRNVKTMIKEANFFGPNSEYIMSGSDDGRIFFWDKKTSKILNVIKGDGMVVNCLQPHPSSSFLLAASGIDHTIKIFMPTADQPTDLSKIRGILRPTSSPNELKPSSPVVIPRSENPEDELDPEKAYESHARYRIFTTSDDDDDDDGDDDIVMSRHLVLHLLREMLSQQRSRAAASQSNARQDEGDDVDEEDEDLDEDSDSNNDNDNDNDNVT
ncbi:WD and tetratricopeptide repeat protein [Mortierella sp. NVP85]|nr:WD and tetratricopeptide repeat protein [Mortierella sp. NVP85]